MLSSALRHRLEALNRETLAEPVLRIAPHTLAATDSTDEPASPAQATFELDDHSSRWASRASTKSRPN